MKLYNSLTRQIEEFVPIHDKTVGIYTCGPTVYSFVTVGNWRTYTLGDIVYRALSYAGYEVTYVMNITDVGHLTGDNLGDADTGEDRLEKAAKKEGKTAWDIAAYYTADFFKGFESLHLTKPRVFAKATDHITEQIKLVDDIMRRGFAYKISDGIYFDTKSYEAAGNTYGELSTLHEIKEGARVEPNPEKKDPHDFALWKFSPTDEKRQMEWDSPWGVGFPGWHIECSAMSMKYLGNQFDIHIGGEDLRATHHPNEIAQSEAATGAKPFVKYWLHGAFLLVDGGRMGKSLGNAYTFADLVKRGFEPLDVRYFFLTGHYRKQLNFTWEALTSAKTALHTLREMTARFKAETDRTVLSNEKMEHIEALSQRFEAALADDLNLPQALAVAWEAAKSNIPGPDKYDLLVDFDRVLGLGLADWQPEQVVIPEVVSRLAEAREEARKAKDFAKADALREEIAKLGFEVLDSADGPVITKQQFRSRA